MDNKDRREQHPSVRRRHPSTHPGVGPSVEATSPFSGALLHGARYSSQECDARRGLMLRGSAIGSSTKVAVSTPSSPYVPMIATTGCPRMSWKVSPPPMYSLILSI